MRRKFPRATVMDDRIPHLFERFEECVRAFPPPSGSACCAAWAAFTSSWNARAQNPEDRWPAKNDFRAAVETWNRANALIRALPEERLRIVVYEEFFGGSASARRSLLDFIGVEEGPGFRKGAAATYRRYAEVVQAKRPLVIEGQEAHLAVQADAGNLPPPARPRAGGHPTAHGRRRRI